MLKFIFFPDKKKYPPITFEYSQEEIAAKAGIKVAIATRNCRKTLKCNLSDRFVLFYLPFGFWLKRTDLPRCWHQGHTLDNLLVFS